MVDQTHRDAIIDELIRSCEILTSVISGQLGGHLRGPYKNGYIDGWLDALHHARVAHTSPVDESQAFVMLRRKRLRARLIRTLNIRRQTTEKQKKDLA